MNLRGKIHGEWYPFPLWLSKVSCSEIAGLGSNHLATKHTLTRPGQRRFGSFYTLVDLATLYIPNHLVAVSAVMRDQISRMPGFPKGKVSVIRNTIDCSSYYLPQMRNDCRQELDVSPDCILVGFSGRIVQAKRLDLLLMGFSRALSACPGITARLVIIGEVRG